MHGAGETIYNSASWILGYTRPLHELLSLTMDGYSQGMRDGDNFHGIFNLLLHYVILPYIMGRPLGPITRCCQRISAQVEEGKFPEQVSILQVYWQMMLNLQMAPCESSMNLEKEHFNSSSESMETPIQIGTKNFAIGELLLFFGHHETRTERLMGEEKGKTCSELFPGFISGRIETFHRGIAWFAMARRKGKRKYRNKALKIKKLIAKWSKAGDPNVRHFDRMLDAELAVLDKKYGMADQFYKEAILLAARTGHIHHSALFNERFGEYHLEVSGDKDNSKYYIEQAINYYIEWGAMGKAEQLSRNLRKY